MDLVLSQNMKISCHVLSVFFSGLLLSVLGETKNKRIAAFELKKAQSEGIRLLNENLPKEEVLKLQALKSLEVVANGKATKIIVPSEIQNLAGLISSIKEIK